MTWALPIVFVLLVLVAVYLSHLDSQEMSEEEWKAFLKEYQIEKEMREIRRKERKKK